VDREFLAWFDAVVRSNPRLFVVRPEVRFPIRWLPGSAISPEHPLVTELKASAREAIGDTVPVEGIEGPCDLFVFQQHFSTPAVLWGPGGDNTHGADEYLDLDSAALAAKALLLFVSRWCGLQN
jgi:acetylornithine deacetylase